MKRIARFPTGAAPPCPPPSGTPFGPRRTGARGWIALGAGIAAGFMTLAALYLLAAKGDGIDAAILAALAAVLFATAPTWRGRG